MKENTISLTVPNTISICAMAFIGFAALNFVTSFFMGRIGSNGMAPAAVVNGN